MSSFSSASRVVLAAALAVLQAITPVDVRAVASSNNFSLGFGIFAPISSQESATEDLVIQGTFSTISRQGTSENYALTYPDFGSQSETYIPGTTTLSKAMVEGSTLAEDENYFIAVEEISAEFDQSVAEYVANNSFVSESIVVSAGQLELVENTIENDLIITDRSTDNALALNALLHVPAAVSISTTTEENYTLGKVTGEIFTKENFTTIGGIEVATSEPFVFDDLIKICLYGPATSWNVPASEVEIYYQQSGSTTWTKDTAATNQEFVGSDQFCFQTNHLTKFIVGVDTASSSSSSSSSTSSSSSSSSSSRSSGGGGGSISYNPQSIIESDSYEAAETVTSTTNNDNKVVVTAPPPSLPEAVELITEPSSQSNETVVQNETEAVASETSQTSAETVATNIKAQAITNEPPTLESSSQTESGTNDITNQALPFNPIDPPQLPPELSAPPPLPPVIAAPEKALPAVNLNSAEPAADLTTHPKLVEENHFSAENPDALTLPTLLIGKSVSNQESIPSEKIGTITPPSTPVRSAVAYLAQQHHLLENTTEQIDPGFGPQVASSVRQESVEALPSLELASAASGKAKGAEDFWTMVWSLGLWGTLLVWQHLHAQRARQRR